MPSTTCWTDRLDEIGCPVLYVGGEGDPAGPVRSLGVFREHLVDLEATLYPDASHLVPIEVPERFTPLLAGFLERVVERG
jgi:pimeloyl-ACP methyl ester carboxylesterase